MRFVHFFPNSFGGFGSIYYLAVIKNYKKKKNKRDFKTKSTTKREIKGGILETHLIFI